MKIKANELRAKLSEIYSGFANYPLIGVTDDGGALCETCMNENAELIEESFRGDGWHVIAIENDADGGFYCDHCNKDTREPEEVEE